MTYKSMMFSGIPNFANSFGYINASWTLKADLTCEFVCKLLNHMDKNGYSFVFLNQTSLSKSKRIGLRQNSHLVIYMEPFIFFQKQEINRLGQTIKTISKTFCEIKFGKVNDGAISFKQEKNCLITDLSFFEVRILGFSR